MATFMGEDKAMSDHPGQTCLRACVECAQECEACCQADVKENRHETALLCMDCAAVCWCCS